LTKGQPSLKRMIILSELFNENELIRLAASVEKGSEHPLGEAFLLEAGNRNLTLSNPQKFEAHPGFGVSAYIDGKRTSIGNERLMKQEGVDLEIPEKEISEIRKSGQTVICIAIEKELGGIGLIADIVKPESKTVVEKLLKSDLKVIMLTGDNNQTARAIADQVGIKEVISNVLPGEKTKRIQMLQKSNQMVAMVGDGVNDAPALAQADVGIALGTGTDVAVATAPITLLSGNLQGVSNAISLSQKTLGTIRQNLFWAFFYNAILIPVAAIGLLNPMLAAGAMAFSSIFVVSNSLRLRNASF